MMFATIARRAFFKILSLGLACLAMGVGYSAQAAGVTVDVLDAAGLPLADSVVYAEAAGGQVLPKTNQAAEIEQRARKFAPLVTVVQTGTEISFPNNDTVRHHVYSFSTPKPFELKLYSGVPGKAILFDKPGTVVLGCNIHDQMLAYIQVVDTPYFARTDASGKAHIDGMPAGKYMLKVWHYKTPATAQILEKPLLMGASDTSASFRLPARAAAVN